MSFARIKETFFRLPKHTKFIGIGALILAIATLLPWYADLDSYKIGDEFLGITGPASFVGIVILLLSGLSLWIFSYRLFERHVPRLPVREAILHLFVAVESLFLLLLVNSIFFHPKFGVNITLKESRFGMTFAIIGAMVLFIGGYLQNKEEIAKEGEEGKLEPLIKMEERPHAPVAPRPSRSEVTSSPERERKIYPHAKGFMFGEGKPAASQPAPRPPEKPSEKSGGGSYMIRTDL
jgi:hypothetical protein